MKIIDKIISIFKPEKFNIVCHNDKEWINTQKELFKLGYKWESQKFRKSEKLVKNLILERGLVENWGYPILIKNYRTGDKFGGKYLILDDYRYVIKIENIKLQNAITFLRKLKLKKLKNVQI
jgi:hypothetical protein